MEKEYDLSGLLSNIIVIDTETTGTDHHSDDIIEYCSTVYDGESSETTTIRIKPNHSIPPESSAIHFISDYDVKDASEFKSQAILIKNELNSRDYIVGHNLNFDLAMLNGNFLRSGVISSEDMDLIQIKDRRICTLELAKKLYAEDPSFANLTLGYLWFKLKLNELHHDKKITPHAAGDDVFMCTEILVYLTKQFIKNGMIDVNRDICAQLVEITQTPTLYKLMPFGKHKGEFVSDIPTSYLEWLVKNSEILDEEKPTFNADFAYTVVFELSKRMGL